MWDESSLAGFKQREHVVPVVCVCVSERERERGGNPISKILVRVDGLVEGVYEPSGISCCLPLPTLSTSHSSIHFLPGVEPVD